jgi:hypothetical protein
LLSRTSEGDGEGEQDPADDVAVERELEYLRENRKEETTHLTTPDASATSPTLSFIIPSSPRILASTGSAVMHDDVPRKTMNVVNLTPG